ncbi:MAG: DUF4395 family protein [Chloroflexota bacterium]|nr:DUF4395 family protein [Chloroflexota bacterium]
MFALPIGASRPRTADPYRDTDVIDSRAPRVNQMVVGLVSLLAFATGWWPLLGILALQLVVGLRFGRRFCLACVAYFELIQPRFGEGVVEDSRPPRFANVVGAVVLTGASLAHAFGLNALGWVLGLLVAALALLAAATGLCVGCEMYKLGARVRGIRSGHLATIDPVDVGVWPRGAPSVVVQFTHPLCTECRLLDEKLRSEGRHVVAIDVSRRPALARKYGVAVVPTAVSVDARGTVLARVA